MNKFLYSGCSYTNFGYPTWADIIAYDKITRGEIDRAYNVARDGACNSYIYSSLLRAMGDYGVTDSDIVGVCWSTPWRNSVISEIQSNAEKVDNGFCWNTRGNVHQNNLWDLVGNHADIVNNDVNLMHNTVVAYQSAHKAFNIDFEFRLPSNTDIRVNAQMPEFDDFFYLEYITRDNGMIDHDLINYIERGYRKFAQVETLIRNAEADTAFNRAFMHPDILEHLSWAQRVCDISPDTVTECERVMTYISDTLEENIDNYDNFHDLKTFIDQNCYVHKQMPGWSDIVQLYD